MGGRGHTWRRCWSRSTTTAAGRTACARRTSRTGLPGTGRSGATTGAGAARGRRDGGDDRHRREHRGDHAGVAGLVLAVAGGGRAELAVPRATAPLVLAG